MPNPKTILSMISDAMRMAQAPRAPRELNSMAKRARAFYGVTEDPAEAGYILPTGEMLNLSGAGRTIDDFRATAKQFPWMYDDLSPGRRNLPHASINDVLGVNVPRFLEGSGAVRMDAPESLIEATMIPTGAQRQAAVEFARNQATPLTADATAPWGRSLGYTSMDEPPPGALNRFYSETLQKRALTDPAVDIMDVLKALETNPSSEVLSSRLDELLQQLPSDVGALNFLRKPQ